MGGVTNHPPKRIEKTCALFSSSVFKIKSDVKCESIQSKFKYQHSQIYVCLLQCLVTCEDRNVIL